MRTLEQEKSHQDAKRLDLRHQETWTGKYRGIPFSIKRHTSGGLGHEPNHNAWCYYLYLNKQNFTPEDWARILTPPRKLSIGDRWYYDGDALDSCEFHGGITWFDVRCQPCDADNPIIEVGCDYQHLWDRESGYPYDLNYILHDVKRSIDCLHRDFKVLVYSYIDGTYHPEAELTEYNKRRHAELFPAKSEDKND